ncbi:MAG: hypothetical protein A1D16_09790 [Flavihumibacter sp. CACIAM 22H1]|nr:MAG: hypothetical protein A1D16_09790 [Flavihumibacter sp. CACIAM 22H1]
MNDFVRGFDIATILFPNIPNKDFLLLSTFTIIEYIILASYLYILLKTLILKRLLLVFSLVFLLVAIGNIIIGFRSNSLEFDTVPIAVSSIILISGSITYFFESIQNPNITFIYSKSSFWVVVGIMIYFSGTFFLFLQYDNLSQQERANFWTINLICFVLKNIFFSISFTLKPENQQSLNVDDYYYNKLE